MAKAQSFARVWEKGRFAPRRGYDKSSHLIMRFGRWVILAAIFLIVAFVGDTYIKRKTRLAKDAPGPPPALELGLEGRGEKGCWTQNEGDRPRVEVCWDRYRQISEPSTMELDGVVLKLYQKGASQFDLAIDFAALAALACIFFVLGARQFSRIQV